MKSDLTGNVDQDWSGGGGFSTEKKMEMGLGLGSKLKPFVDGGIAALLTDTQFSFLPIGITYHKASNIKDQVKKQLLYKNCNTAFKVARDIFPTHIIIKSLMFGSFEILTRKAAVTTDGMLLSFYQEVGCALLAATIGHGICAPLVTARYLMWADLKLPVEKRANYRNIYDALYRISAKGGMSALWHRKAFVENPSLGFYTVVLASYHRSLNYFEDSFAFDETKACLSAGSISGFCGSVFDTPFYTAQLHMKQTKPNAQGKYPYTSSLDCALKILKSEGLFTLYRKFPQVAGNVIPRTMMMWWILKEIQKPGESHGI